MQVSSFQANGIMPGYAAIGRTTSSRQLCRDVVQRRATASLNGGCSRPGISRPNIERAQGSRSGARRRSVLACRASNSDAIALEDGKARQALTDWQMRRINLALGESLRIGEVEGKGYGVFATRDALANDVLLEERPYLLPPPVAAEIKQDVYTLVYALSSGKEEGAEGLLGWLFDALHCHKMVLGPKEEMLRKVLPVVRQLAEGKLGPEAGVADLSDDDMMELYQTIRTNMQASGGLYIGCSMINHSCQPNAVAATKGQNDANYSVVALVDIKEGQEVSIPYIDFSQPVIDRQSALQAMYGFRCTCPKCCTEIDNIGILGGKQWAEGS